MSARSGNAFFALFKSVLPILAAYLVLLVWGYLIWQAWHKAPTGSVAQDIVIEAKNAPLTLGFSELGQRAGPRAAAAQHLRITRQGAEWVLFNVSTGKRVLVSSTQSSGRFLERWQLRQGDRISFDGADFTVTQLSGTSLTLVERGTNREVTWTGGSLMPKGETLHTLCRNTLSRWLQTGKWISRDWLTSDKPELRLFSIGGGITCSDRWEVAKLPLNAAFVVWQNGRYWVAPGTRRPDTLFFRQGQTRGTSFADIALPLTGELGRVTSLIVGSTRYVLAATPERLTFQPLTNRDFFYEDEPQPPNATRWSWIGDGNKVRAWMVQRTVAIGFGVLAAAIAALLILFWWRKRHPHEPGWLIHTLAAVVPSLIGLWVTLLLQQRTGQPDAILPVAAAGAAWFWATFMLTWSGRMSGFPAWIWLFAMTLVAIGTVNMFQLGAGADNTRWLGYAGSHVLILGGFGWAMAMLTAVSIVTWRRLWLFMFNRETFFTLLAILLIGLLMMQFIVGSQEGLAGIQPVEMVKTVLVVLLGYIGLHITETRQREAKAYRTSPIMFLLPYFRFASVFFLIVVSVVVGVKDFSPMVIMALVLLAFLWKLGGSQGEFYGSGWAFKLMRPTVLLGLALIAVAAYYAYKYPDSVPHGFPKRDRIFVWSQPELHPHSGAQVLGSLDAIGQAGWFGAKEWFGANGPIMNLPAVHNDFITAFLINRWGGAVGLFMLIVQLCYVALLFALSRATERELAAGDFREQNAGVVLGYAIYGLAWMHLIHWMISWGNVLGLLPVMGQPMTFITAGNSHLLFFGLAIVAIGLITSWVIQSYRDETPPAAVQPP